MNPPLTRPQIRTCPSCGSAMSVGSISCRSCGGVVAVETVVRRFKSELRAQSARIAESLRDHKFRMWVFALIPLLFIPPIIAILMNFRSPKNHESPDQAASPDVLVIIASICNIILSVLLWRWLADVAVSMGLSIGLLFKSIGITRPVPLPSV